ncbi:MAG: sigma-70 family RNA polymerase sigma factor [Sphingomonadaceae bacterium]|nr:sigma-70 family RNA polymerase sigma factor [Sphingomonadaceae bacterium]MCP5384151.1 sigma-70 family RNA polymerase sigma factor [Altererythrobacter sp.]MCP5392967.1 sigma-70 family RNA polymerase sigma factor [Sphingomonadaceae bacterium]
MLAKDTEMLIVDWGMGDTTARDRAIARLYPELQQIASARLRREVGSSMSTHDLVNDAVEKILRIENPEIGGRTHFVALASRVMRNVLVDHVRAKSTDKRHHHKVELNTRIQGEGPVDLARLNSALVRLEAIDAELMEIVEMRYFGGMTVPEVAEVTGWSEPTVKRRWQVARAWLADAMSNPLDHG